MQYVSAHIFHMLCIHHQCWLFVSLRQHSETAPFGFAFSLNRLELLIPNCFHNSTWHHCSEFMPSMIHQSSFEQSFFFRLFIANAYQNTISPIVATRLNIAKNPGAWWGKMYLKISGESFTGHHSFSLGSFYHWCNHTWRLETFTCVGSWDLRSSIMLFIMELTYSFAGFCWSILL